MKVLRRSEIQMTTLAVVVESVGCVMKCPFDCFIFCEILC